MAFVDGGTAAQVSGYGPPLFVTSSGAWVAGDLIGISSNTFVQADSDGGIPAFFVAGRSCASGDKGVPLYLAAKVYGGSRYTGGTKGAPLYLSNTAGLCSESAGTVVQFVGMTLDDGISTVLTPSNYLGAGKALGALDMGAFIISNIGNAGTDFLSNGGLTLANALTVTTGGATIGGLTAVTGEVTSTTIIRAGAASDGSTPGTGVVKVKVGTAPVGAATTTAMIYTDGTLLKKMVADGTASTVG